jgi:hypothetical protein
MSALRPSETAKFEKLFGMNGGYVLNFSDSSFGIFFGQVADIDIHADQYCKYGSSKARKLRCFWTQAEDALAGRVLEEMVGIASTIPNYSKDAALIAECLQIAKRIQGCTVNLGYLRKSVEPFNSAYITKQIHRMEQAVDSDPDLAIGTAKELIETCCKSILEERGKAIPGMPDMPTLTKTTFKELNLVPELIHESARGKDTIKRILSNLSTIGNGLAELRGLYGTGHGKEHQTSGLEARHAKLATGAAAALVTFLFETHRAREKE